MAYSDLHLMISSERHLISYKQSILEEPEVISDELLKVLILAHGPKDPQAHKFFEEEGIDYTKVTDLKLEFNNILRIENLWQFNALQKLQLSNNVIEKIEGLEELTNLTWLDLSFNRIEVICGLENLTNIVDLSLFSNKIKTLENLDALKKLQIFSIGNNLIEDFNNVIYLRSFKNLHCLCISGNPLTTDEGYTSQVIAFLHNLKYLNYRLITQETRDSALEKYKHEVEKMEAYMKTVEEKQLAQIASEEKHVFHTCAFVENLDDSRLLELIYEEDKDGFLLFNFPPAKDIVASFQENFKTICMEWLQVGLLEHSLRSEEIDQFFGAIQEAKMCNRAYGIAEIKHFILYKSKVFQRLMSLSEGSEENLLSDEINSATTEFEKKLSILWNSLMGLEMQLTDQIAELYEEFKNAVMDMEFKFTDHIKDFSSKLLNLDETFTSNISQFFSEWYEKTPEDRQEIISAKNEEEEEEEVYWDPEVLSLLQGDEQCIQIIIQEGHLKHDAVIRNKKETSIEGLQQWTKDTLQNFCTKEIDRNRHRIMEINHFCDAQREELDEVCGYPTVFELPF